MLLHACALFVCLPACLCVGFGDLCILWDALRCFLFEVGGLGAGSGVVLACRLLVRVVFCVRAWSFGLRRSWGGCCVLLCVLCRAWVVCLSPLVRRRVFLFGEGGVWRALAWACWLRLLLRTRQHVLTRARPHALSPSYVRWVHHLSPPWLLAGSQDVSAAARVCSLCVFACVLVCGFW